MRDVPLIDASGVGALESFVRRCASRGTQVIVTGVQAQPRSILKKMGFGRDHQGLRFAESLEEAIRLAAD
jgi:SulP family sulfate permease